MSVSEPAGSIVLPELPDPLDSIWDTILELAQRLPVGRWALIGGQMVVLHGLAHGRPPPRITRDVDVLAPDHSPPRWPLTTVPPRRTIQVDGGRQALARAVNYEVSNERRSALVSVPDVLGALILKAAAYLADSRDRDRHAYDAAFLAGLVEDPRAVRGAFKGSDRKRLQALDRAIADRAHPAWRALGEAADDSYITWRLLIAD